MQIQALFFEFFVVVFGILSALFINKINQKRNHKKRIHSIMDIVKNDLIKDLKDAEKSIQNINKNILFEKVVNGDKLTEKEKKQSMDLATNYPSFQVSTRGFNLLKDAKVDFDFKDSDLITEIINLYDMYLDIFKSYSLYLRNNSERNLRSFMKYSWSVEFYKFEISEGYLKFLESAEYKAMISYHNMLIDGPWKNALLGYQKEIKETLEKIELSEFN